MKRSLFIAALLAWPVLGWSEGTKIESALANALAMWKPSAISVSGRVATVQTKENRVTEKSYLAMVDGVCVQTLAEPGSLSGLSEVKFLIRHGSQGYVFEGGELDCWEYVKSPIKKTKLWVLGRTHLN